MTISVPSINDPDFLRLESIIDSEFEAIEILTEIDNSQKELDCFNIVKDKVNNCGGRMILGWQIWKTKILIEAEAHAVWEDENEDLHDISPKSLDFSPKKILFIEDHRLKYEGKQIENIRLNITKNKLVDHFIEIAKLFFYFQNKGIRSNYYDLSKILNENELKEIENINNWKNILQYFIYQGNTETSICFCGGTKQYKNCHGKDFYKQLEKIKTKRS